MCGRAGTRMPAWLNTNGGSLNGEQLVHLVDFITAPVDPNVLDENGVPTSKGWKAAVEFAHNLNRETTILVTGDSLQTIADVHGVGVAETAELNGIDLANAGDFIAVGTIVKLPPVDGAPDGGTFKVNNERDSIATIVKGTYAGAAILADLNNLDYDLNYHDEAFHLLDGGSEVPGLLTGQLLALPDGSTYSVNSGETIQGIADLHGISTDDLIAANPDLEGTDVTADLAPADADGNIPDVTLNLPKIDAYVTRGQTWDQVAEAWGNVTGESLAEANNSATNVALRVSQPLGLPADAYGGTPPETINDGSACVQYAVPSNIYDQIKTGEPLTPPPPFEGTVVAKDIAFVQTQITLPPNTEVTITFDNQDTIQHNIQFFKSATPGGDKLTGCTSGCPTDDVATEVTAGPVMQTFTFTTPDVGTYSFDCAVHATMKGTLTIEEGAEVPAASQP